MIYVLTVHHRAEDWIPIQLDHLRRNLPEHRVHACLEDIDPSWEQRFDRVLPVYGKHAPKLNALAADVDGADDDLLIFLDGDAFPIRPPMPTVERALERGNALVAIRRAETLTTRQPHPAFCAVRLGRWREIEGDWSNGYRWVNEVGESITDVGANLLQTLEQRGLPWADLTRTNRHNLHPVFFGIYGGLIYHHGAGFRRRPYTRLEKHLGGSAKQRIKQNRRLASKVLKQAQEDPGFWRQFE